jgi:hypothetical protein
MIRGWRGPGTLPLRQRLAGFELLEGRAVLSASGVAIPVLGPTQPGTVELRPVAVWSTSTNSPKSAELTDVGAVQRLFMGPRLREVSPIESPAWIIVRTPDPSLATGSAVLFHQMAPDEIGGESANSAGAIGAGILFDTKLSAPDAPWLSRLSEFHAASAAPALETDSPLGFRAAFFPLREGVSPLEDRPFRLLVSPPSSESKTNVEIISLRPPVLPTERTALAEDGLLLAHDWSPSPGNYGSSVSALGTQSTTAVSRPLEAGSSNLQIVQQALAHDSTPSSKSLLSEESELDLDGIPRNTKRKGASFRAAAEVQIVGAEFGPKIGDDWDSLWDRTALHATCVVFPNAAWIQSCFSHAGNFAVEWLPTEAGLIELLAGDIVRAGTQSTNKIAGLVNDRPLIESDSAAIELQDVAYKSFELAAPDEVRAIDHCIVTTGAEGMTAGSDN